jgi:hypothetical protein
MTSKLNRLAGWGAFAGLLGAAVVASSPASAITTFNPGGAGVIIGNNSDFTAGAIWENTISHVGQTLTGIGRVDTINSGSCGNGGLCWQNGDNGVELAFNFAYTVASITILSGNANRGTAEVRFTGGIANFFTGPTGFADGYGGTQAIDFARVLTGSPWLNLVGGTAGCTGCSSLITLDSVYTYGPGGVSVVDPAPKPTGVGTLDVAAGPGVANAYFDTNSFIIDAIGHDILLGSSFTKDTTGSDFPLTGSADLTACIADPTGRIPSTCVPTKVPEPNSLLLLGTGLASLAGFSSVALRRRRRASA